MSLTCCNIVRIHGSVLFMKNVTDTLQHSENTFYCSMGHNMSLTCCSMVRIHISVQWDKYGPDMLQHNEKTCFIGQKNVHDMAQGGKNTCFCSMGQKYP